MNNIYNLALEPFIGRSQSLFQYWYHSLSVLGESEVQKKVISLVSLARYKGGNKERTVIKNTLQK